MFTIPRFLRNSVQRLQGHLHWVSTGRSGGFKFTLFPAYSDHYGFSPNQRDTGMSSRKYAKRKTRMKMARVSRRINRGR